MSSETCLSPEDLTGVGFGSAMNSTRFLPNRAMVLSQINSECLESSSCLFGINCEVQFKVWQRFGWPLWSTFPRKLGIARSPQTVTLLCHWCSHH